MTQRGIRNNSNRRHRGERMLVTLAGLLTLSAGGALLNAEHAQVRAESIAGAFQSLVHGTGLGPAADLSGCAFAFDPRIAPQCAQDIGPLPLGSAYCPYHTLSLFSSAPRKPGGADAESR